ncbi:MAG: hypothetical protein J6R20_06110 [Clostridia bacterium]|nr:hypothetical protein [Clostridia bacterium]
MKRVVSVLMAVILLFICTACTPKGSGKSIAYPLSASPSTLDPQFVNDINSMIVINNTFEGLVRLDADGKIIPGIASDWEISPDGMTYTFHLKEGTEWFCPTALKSEFGADFYKKFSSEKVTAHDFVFAFRRAVMPETNSPSAHRLFVIENAPEIYSGSYSENLLGATAPDDYTLVIRLTEKCDDFLERLTESVFMPCNEEFFTAMNGRYGLSNRHILCNGPFYVSSWDSETSLTVKRNGYYSGEQAVMPASVVFSFDADKTSVSEKLSNGGATAALLPPDYPIPENCSSAKESENSVFGFIFNCSDEILSNAYMRLALCKSIDRSLFKETENAKPQSGFVPRSCLVGADSYRDKVGSQTPCIEQDLADSANLWKAGLEEIGKNSVKLTVLCPEWLDAPVRQQLQIWQKNLGISIGITIENKTPEEIRNAVSSGNFQIALSGIESEYENTTDFLASFADGGVFRFHSVGYKNAVEALVTSETYDKTINGCFSAESFILQNAVCYPLYSRASHFVVYDEADGITVSGAENTVSFINAKRYD